MSEADGCLEVLGDVRFRRGFSPAVHVWCSSVRLQLQIHLHSRSHRADVMRSAPGRWFSSASSRARCAVRVRLCPRRGANHKEPAAVPADVIGRPPCGTRVETPVNSWRGDCTLSDGRVRTVAAIIRLPERKKSSEPSRFQTGSDPPPIDTCVARAGISHGAT